MFYLIAFFEFLILSKRIFVIYNGIISLGRFFSPSTGLFQEVLHPK